MPEKINVPDLETVVNNSFENDLEITKLMAELSKKFSDYKKTLDYMACDAPIEILGLPKSIETILISQNFLRVYDLLNRDFTEIKGLGDRRIRDLTSCLDQFFSML